jgi:S-adenosylmethionine decarboxylase proenzyme
MEELIHNVDIDTEYILAKIAESAQLAEGSEGVRTLLLTMYRYSKINNKELARKTGIAVPALAAVRGELYKAGIIESRHKLGDIGREWVRKRISLSFDTDPLPNDLQSYILNLPEALSNLVDIEEILEERPSPDFSLDQSRADYNTVVGRTLYLLSKGDLEGRNIVFLGDDDAISLAVGLTNLAYEITVVDIDSRIIEFLTKQAERLKIKNIRLIEHNLKDPCPKNILNRFDVVVTDPPYTDQGLRLFLKRAGQVLKTSVQYENESLPVIGKKCLLSFGNKPPIETEKIQLSILEHAFTIKEMIPAFNRYLGSRILGQYSHLYYLEMARAPSSESSVPFGDRPLYTREIRDEPPVFRPQGYHLIGEMYGISQEYLLNNQLIRNNLLETLNSSELSVVDVFQHNYSPWGYSIIAILEHSHATIHTWPEHGYASVDIFLCDEFEKGKKAMMKIKSHLSPKESETMWMERGSGRVTSWSQL